MGLMIESNARFVGRDEIAQVPTPIGTVSWKPVPHMEVIDAVGDVVNARGWRILDEQYGLARDGQKLFGVMRINRSSSPEWSRCIGIRNSHDRSLSVGLTAGFTGLVCANFAFGGSMVFKRRHTRLCRVRDLGFDAGDAREEEFLTLETVAEGLKIDEVGDDEVRASIVKAAEIQAIPSCDILNVWKEFKEPKHEEFAEPNRGSVSKACSETVLKYSPARADLCYRGLTRLFGLDGREAVLWRK